MIRLRCAAKLLTALLAAPLSQAVRAVDTSIEAKETVLFIGNSFLFGSGSPVRFYRADTVTDLNHGGVGGVPALFKAFSDQAHRNYSVNLETASGKGLDYHFTEKSDLIAQYWDHVIMLGYSTLDRDKPGDPALLTRSAGQVADLLHSKNPQVDIRLIATWPRADQVYPKEGFWNGKPVETMAVDIAQGYELAAKNNRWIRGIIPVGKAWIRAFREGIADPNPYDGVSFGLIDLWTHDHYHASAYGYYLEALLIFGDLTELDPRSLGKEEHCAFELGFSAAQTIALQTVAAEELLAKKGPKSLNAFTPAPLAIANSDTSSLQHLR